MDSAAFLYAEYVFGWSALASTSLLWERVGDTDLSLHTQEVAGPE